MSNFQLDLNCIVLNACWRCEILYNLFLFAMRDRSGLYSMVSLAQINLPSKLLQFTYTEKLKILESSYSVCETTFLELNWISVLYCVLCIDLSSIMVSFVNDMNYSYITWSCTNWSICRMDLIVFSRYHFDFVNGCHQTYIYKYMYYNRSSEFCGPN